ncbi:TraX family protein [Nostoc sp. CENA543]|uniref:TraX family protein n=1 Tax=Nostoc sp. CENA543 TaxID=1869241 RepID=UPI000CA2D740|nr:TraX family protein [Nostoc sp. CENA543]AUT01337.1 TraX family protein [Nostoc sp. CENA543]
MNNYQIKVLAATLMLGDHIAYIFQNHEINRYLFSLHLIGRLSFPLFAWLLVQGESHTRNFWLYLSRLLILGVISQSIYTNVSNSTSLNILFTLSLALICLRMERLKPKLQILFWLPAIIFAEGAGLEYGAYGIVLVYLVKLITTSSSWLIGVGLWIGLHILYLWQMISNDTGDLAQFLAIFAPLIFKLTNYQQGRKTYFFYIFYPLHLFILFLVKISLKLEV